MDHYRNKMPVWVLLEVIPFGTMLTFYLHCVKRYGMQNPLASHLGLVAKVLDAAGL
ncbi:hypothetical protein [Adlercreutzia sp. ZJ138]|uniref:hypothetical protein n=1 Tax=Adlercreutzia sp. ZJ138 TaxID=2709405 RepID=UPI00351BC104